jgi:DNA-directed RNA polymerase subunit alpha
MHILHDEIGSPNFKIISEKKTEAILTVSPLPSGFGTTVGNSFRRTMLSSLPGTAAFAFKIDGVSHEYSTVTGIKESVLDISLNIRQLRLRKHTKGEELVEVSLKKNGVITAGDLKVSSDIEILEPSQIIATCDGADPKKKITLKVDKGVGYKLISNKDNAEEADPEFILIDANYSPITRVKYEIAPARVGDNTNLDKLILTVETNGAIDAEIAIKLSAGILEDYFALFNNEDAYIDEDFTTTFEKIKQKKEAAELQIAEEAAESFTPIDILGFSQRTLNALVNGGITSVEQLLVTPMVQLAQFRGFGQKAKTELETVLVDRGYTLSIENKTN